MKKFKFLILLPFLLFSCKAEKTKEKINIFHYENISYQNENKTDYMFYSLSSDDFDTRMKKNDSFLLYVNAEGCDSCSAFGYILKDYIKNDKVIVNYMTIDSYLKTFSHLSLSESTFLIIKQGKTIEYKSDFSSFGSYRDFKDYLNEYIIDTSIYFKNTSKINNSENSYITYQFESRMFDVNETKFSLQKGNYLFVKEKSLSDYSLIDEKIKENEINYIVFNEEEQSYLNIDGLNFDSQLTLFSVN